MLNLDSKFHKLLKNLILTELHFEQFNPFKNNYVFR